MEQITTWNMISLEHNGLKHEYTEQDMSKEE